MSTKYDIIYLMCHKYGMYPAKHKAKAAFHSHLMYSPMLGTQARPEVL